MNAAMTAKKVEIKAKVADINGIVSKVQELSDSTNGIESYQEDTFFCVENGRLKLRQSGVSEHFYITSYVFTALDKRRA
jgi:adenylate cyclase class IV